MNVKSIVCLFLFVLFVVGFSCNNASHGDEFANEGDKTSENKGRSPGSNFNEMDNKMRELMNVQTQDPDSAFKEIKVIEGKDAHHVQVELKIGAGKLKLAGGSSELLLAGFIYSDASWKPQIDYTIAGQKGYLVITQPDLKNQHIGNDDKYVWNLKFNNQIPLDFNIELGAGMSEIKLSGLNLENFSMNMGIGKSEIDLRGNWNKSTSINLNGGIGVSKIYLPKNVGIRVHIDKGIGSASLGDLIKKSGNLYVNKLAETSDIVLTINLKTGIGRIEVE
jgi:hypothetical protein